MAKEPIRTVDDSALSCKHIRVRDLMFFLTTQCDLRCKHCYVGDRWLQDACSFDNGEAASLLHHFGSMGLDRLTFLGGEPTRYPYLASLIEQARSYSIGEKRITTNGVRLKYFNLKRIQPNDFAHVSFSFDGHNAETHDYIRGKGTFQKSLGNMMRLRDIGFRIHVTFTVMRSNIENLESAVEFFQALGVRELNFHVMSSIGNGSLNSYLAISPREWVIARKHLESMKTVSGMSLRIPLMFVSADEYREELRRGYRPFQYGSYHCPNGGNRLVLYPNGRVYMSCDLTGTDFNFAFFKSGKFSLNENRNELSEIDKNPNLSDPSAVLLDLDSSGLIPLSISYKRVVRPLAA